MKKLFMVLSLLLVAGMLANCGSTNTTNTASTTSLQQYNITGSLQGKIMDAVTGAAIGGSDLKVWLIQGTSIRTPNTLIADSNNPLVGNYAFNNIPADINTGDIRYKVVVAKPGYQGFEADVELLASIEPGNIVDGVYNKIGNIYLYPLGSSAGDVNVYVYDPNGLPIPGARVLLLQNVTNNRPNAIISNYPNPDRLVPEAGLYPELNATTNAAGLATFTSGTLTLGGSYTVTVQAMTFNGEQLQTNNASPYFIVGTASTDRVVNMAVATGAPLLFAASASNAIPGTITASGVLTIVFNQPVILDTAAFTAALSGGSGGVLGAPAVTAALSADGMTLTLTPNITTAPTAKGASITYGYTGNVGFGVGVIGLKNAQVSSGLTLFGTLTDITTGNAVSGTIQLLSY